jgi:hypothetical protein
VRVGPSEGEYAFGPYVGGDVHAALTPWMAVMAGIRVRLTSSRGATIQVVDLVDPDENPWVPDMPEVATALDGRPLELPGTRWCTLVGVKVFLR